MQNLEAGNTGGQLGTSDADMALAANTVRRNRGGIAFVVNGSVLGEVPLPVARL